MKLAFQKTISTSQATLPVVVAIGVLLWVVGSGEWTAESGQRTVSYMSSDYGLWRYVPASIQGGWWTVVLSLLMAVLAVYLMLELNNSNVLLRINSRMLASTLAFLLALVESCHHLQPGCVVMVLSLSSFFSLFLLYQNPNPALSFITSLLLSMASLVFPKMMWLMPLYWFLMTYIRALSFKCLVASVLGLLLPYWFYAGIAFITDSMPSFIEHAQAVGSVRSIAESGQWRIDSVAVLAFVAMLFVTGSVDFHHRRFLDKTRTRVLYNVVMIHGVYILILICLMPTYHNTLLPLLLIDTAIVFGHFFAFTHTRLSHIYCIILLCLSVAVGVLQHEAGA